MPYIKLTAAERRKMGRRLRAARDLADLSLGEVAEDRGTSRNAPAEWERGSVPSAEHRAALARLYHVDEDQLFREVAARRAATAEILAEP